MKFEETKDLECLRNGLNESNDETGLEKDNRNYLGHKAWFSYIATIVDCKTKNVTEFVSKKLPVKHDGLCPTIVPDNH